MKYRSLHLIYFSPTHTSAKIIYAIAEGMGISAITETDLTCKDIDLEEYIDDELAIVAAPVYGGRVAESAMERFRKFRSRTKSPVVPVVVYGNRDYEDALRELTDLMIEQGFIPVGAGAFIGEHSYSRKGMPIAEGRPDRNDLMMASDFGRKVMAKLNEEFDVENLSPLVVKGNYPYKVKGKPTPQTPITKDELCVLCGYCIDICPTHAISLVEGAISSDARKCIKCCACVKDCPKSARIFDTPYTAKLYQNCRERKIPEIFL